ncbi:glycosyltransferase family 2 protein [Candidatus Uhrbacteria bacterium CG10_big_fil_rev_8_21_14_0_10_48_11]|uniref:Glycosyltransferase family 2 protein n=1 Tax=Candidatus Uhrbacteria bacterium CG10_big_fil_rev_8_21_14_0_10_48_11 TaxID=1975037 RepID=A0A2M8LEH7_9BACT|nr:MAG: glycosyltransferase family 2 protein [Candidatus Uhrbacteria bacterium CG10_big_fil_rev_8_21_14_0_10_48_11]
MRIFAVIPAFNEASGIAAVVASVLPRVQRVVVVDDGSTDATAAEAKRAGAVVLHHRINRGQGAALATGAQYALRHGAEVLVHFDADGQHDSNDIEALVKPIVNDVCDVVLGSRFLGSAPNLPFAKRLLLKAGILFTRIFSGIWLTDTNNGLRAFSANAARRLPVRQDGMAHASEIIDGIADLSLRYVEVPVTIHYTPYAIARGQRKLNAVRIVRDLVLDKFFPHD